MAIPTFEGKIHSPRKYALVMGAPVREVLLHEWLYQFFRMSGSEASLMF
jgi:hypothetical protein